nr:PREDICTED: aminoacyl tRNA synthase complex-interacting multifunctional protein 1-like isoform X2 [Bemisia tabaci]
MQVSYLDDNDVAAIKLSHLIQGDSNGSLTTAGNATSRPIDVSRLDLRVGRIEAIQEIRTTQKMFRFAEVDVGETISRSVISELVNNIPLEDLENREVVVLCNIKPWKMLRYVSEGTFLCAKTDDKIEVLEPPPDCTPGDEVTVAGYSGTADRVLDPKLKMWEIVSADLKVNEDGVACYKGTPLRVQDKGLIKTETLKNVSII